MRYLTEEEAHVASRFLFLSMAMVVLEQDRVHVQNGAFKIKEPYLQLIDQMISDAKTERRRLRKIIHHKNIQIISVNQDDNFSSYLFICQGREEKCHFFNPVIRQKVKEMIHELMDKARQSFPLSRTLNS